MMIRRQLGKHLVAAAKKYPVITLTGPRQSGKTTLVREVFSALPYVSVENPDTRSFAIEDPRGFLEQFPTGAILDEVQNTPDLLSYIQGIVDAEDSPGRFVLTGSQNLLVLARVSQSLAGRTAIFHLLPFSQSELQQRPPLELDDLGRSAPRRSKEDAGNLLETLFRGFYPRIHDKSLEPQDWLRNYYQTYIERDVRSILNVGDIETFGRFVRLCAGRSGQLLSLSSLAADCGISHSTAKRWLSVLEATFIIYLLRPHYRNFNRRLVKSPKLYFMDTGLLCYLLRIRSPEDLAIHASRGPVFETFVVSELLKAHFHSGLEPDVYFWRDSAGHEVDFVLDRQSGLVAIEAKSGQTIADDFLHALNYWRTLPAQEDAPCALVYGGDTTSRRSGAVIYSWRNWL